MISRRLFLGQISAASVCKLGHGIPPSLAREALSSITRSQNPLVIDPSQWKTYGRIVLRKLKDSLLIQDGFAVYEASPADCDFSFEARAPREIEEVQIWAGIRCRDRDSRYVFALRGGNNNDLYLARYALDGQIRFLGIAPLDFHPEPETWYQMRAVIKGRRIQIHVNGEPVPRLDVIDDTALWESGGVSLGGGWLPVEFRDISIRPVTNHTTVSDTEEQSLGLDSAKRNQRSVAQRKAYRAAVLDSLTEPRTEFSLNGKWLFAPDQELPTGASPQAVAFEDASWHVMDVPNFWTPCLTWLHGETGFPDLQGISSSKGLSDRLWRAEIERLDSYTFDWQQTSSGWYRHYIELPAEIGGRRFELCFDAIAKAAEVWVNGVKVGSHVGMFGQICCDITAAVHSGTNVVAVHVLGHLQADASNQVMGVAVTVEVTAAMLKSLPHGMYREEAVGIWQPVKLIATRQTWIEDIYVKPQLDGAEFEITLRSQVQKVIDTSISYAIRSLDDGTILYEESAGESRPISSGQLIIEHTTPQLTPRPWSPATPRLYTLEVTLWSDGKIADRRSATFGFRTFSVKDGKLNLNGKPFWLRGGNHFPHAIRPNDAALAKRFMQLAREGNVVATRSHTAPFTETWLQAADEAGIMVSFEGTWPWLMLEGAPPDSQLLEEWSSEFLALIRKARNHPSVVMWTVNNEMKFEEFDRSRPALLGAKWKILSNTVKAIRAIDPTRPVICDSSYCRKSVGKEYEDLIQPNEYDDGDIDDAHRYPGWYEPSFFHYFNGEFGKSLSFPGRPLISQEMSTGYPRNDDGHPCRFYLFKHYTPQALAGYEAYENRDPAIFLQRQALITKELAEAIRRSNRDECSGILHFAYLTWFKDVWNVSSIRPFQTYDALKLALEPVLVSAELFGRHFYAGSQQQIRVCIANDAEDAADLPEGELEWRIHDRQRSLASEAIQIDSVPYYSNQWRELTVSMPEIQSDKRVDVQFTLTLRTNGTIRSENTYDIVVAPSSWTFSSRPIQFAVLGEKGAIPSSLQRSGARFISSPNGFRHNETVVIADGQKYLSDLQIAKALQAHAMGGGRVLVFHGGESLTKLFPDKIAGYHAIPGEIATMRIPESAVFDGIDQLDLAWWEMGSRKIPSVCRGFHQLAAEAKDVEVLAEVVNFHGYLHQPSDLLRVSGSSLFTMRTGAGQWITCEFLLLEAAPFDPIAGKLLSNLLTAISSESLESRHVTGSRDRIDNC